ncbi:hypothetical protein P4374_35145, partial [Bacillus thuringiensis]|nr:hypothetical protein [Bacillus thuringiensis]
LYQGSVGGDDVVDEWDAITRGLRFAVVAIHHVNKTEMQGDPWVEATAKWSEGILGDKWTVYRDILPLGYQRPALLLRLGGLETEQRNRSLFEVRKQVIGHFFGSDAQEQILGAALITEALAEAIKIPLSIEDRRFLTVQNPRLNAGANAITNGQLNVTFKRTTSRISQEVTPIREIFNRFNIH